VNPSHLRSRTERSSGPDDQIREPLTPVDVAGPSRPMVVSLAWDIALNATIPVACYWFSKRFVSPSELTALLVATVFPLLKSGYDVTRHREVDPVALLVLLGIATSMLALVMGGDPRLLLIRESFFTGAFGIACLVSLTFPRPSCSTSGATSWRTKRSAETGDVRRPVAGSARSTGPSVGDGRVGIGVHGRVYRPGHVGVPRIRARRACGVAIPDRRGDDSDRNVDILVRLQGSGADRW
jgi:hypothetical protein